ncbi:hypothetical protein Nmel_016478 [Mimus melanotis]
MAADAGKLNSWAATDPWDSAPKLSHPGAQGFLATGVRVQGDEDDVFGEVKMEQTAKLLPSCDTGKEERAEEETSALSSTWTRHKFLLSPAHPDPISMVDILLYYKEYIEMEKEMCCQMFDPLNSYG